MANYATTSTDTLKYNEFGNGIQWNSLKDWQQNQYGKLMSDATVKLYKSSNGTHIILQYTDTNNLTSTNF